MVGERPSTAESDSKAGGERVSTAEPEGDGIVVNRMRRIDFTDGRHTARAPWLFACPTAASLSINHSATPRAP